MNAKETLDLRHKKALQRLQVVSKGKVYKYGLVKCANAIAPILQVSPQTIMNNISGRSKDGFLVEAIIKEFKVLHINDN